MGLLLAFLNPTSLLNFGGKLLDFLKSPLGIALLIGLAYFIGYWRGKNAAEEICAADKRESQAQAARIDTGVAQSTFQDMQQRIVAADSRALAAQEQIKEERFRASQLSEQLQGCRRLTDEEWSRLGPRGTSP